MLKPIKSDTYIILTEWSGPNSFEVWEKSVAFDFTKIADYQKIFNSAPYVTKYKTQEEEGKPITLRLPLLFLLFTYA